MLTPTPSVQGANVGEIIGLFLNGWISERFGYRKTVMGCLIFREQSQPSIASRCNSELMLSPFQ